LPRRAVQPLAASTVEAVGQAVAVHHQPVRGEEGRLQQVRAAHGEWVEAKLARHAVHQRLEGVAHIDRAVAAHGTTGGQVGVDAPAVVADVRQVVEPVQERAGIEDRDDPVARIGAAAHDHFGLAGGELSLCRHAERQRDLGLGPAAVRDQRLLAGKHQCHAPAGALRQKPGDDLEVQRLGARAEPAADEGLDQPDLRRVHLQAAGEVLVGVEGHLRDRMEHEFVAAGHPFGDGGVGLHLRVVDLGAGKGGGAHQVGRFQPGLGVAEDVMHLALDVALLVVVEKDGIGCAGLGGGEMGGQGVDLDLDQLQRAGGGGGIDGGDGRNGLAAIADAVARHRVFVHRDRQDAEGMPAIGAGDDGQHARQRRGRPGVDAAEHAMRDGAAQDARDGRALGQVGGEAGAAGDLLDPVDERRAATGGAGGCLRRAGRGLGRGVHSAASAVISAAAVSTASMIFT
jgi:hypothetical protein